jgi:hypothetical protein
MISAQIPATTSIREWKWSAAEKIVARRAFEMTLNRELETVIPEAKDSADRIGKLRTCEKWKAGSPSYANA